MASYLSLLNSESSSVVAVELRPPRAELEAAEGMDAWIDTYHAIRSLTRQDVRVMLTDSAVGAQEENNRRHLVTIWRIGRPHRYSVPHDKHSLAFCLALADQAVSTMVFRRVVIGGTSMSGVPTLEQEWRCGA